MDVLPFALPLLQGHSCKIQRLSGGVPVEIVIEGETVAGPVGAEQGSLFEIDGVMLESKGAVLFGAGANDLAFPRKREDIVAHDIVFAVVLMQTTGLGAVDK